MELIGAEKVAEICHNIAAGRLGDDLLVWMPGRDGSFFVCEFLEFNKGSWP